MPVYIGRESSGDPYLMEDMRFPYRCLPPVVSEYCQALAFEIQISVDFVATQVLAATSAAMMGRFAVQVRPDDLNWREYVNIYVLSVQYSGSGKSEVRDRVWEPFTTYEKVLMRRALIRKGSAEVELKAVEEKLAALHALPAIRRTEEQEDALVELHDQACNLRREVATGGD